MGSIDPLPLEMLFEKEKAWEQIILGGKACHLVLLLSAWTS